MRSTGRRNLLAVSLLLAGILSAMAAPAPGGTAGGCVVPRLTGTQLVVVKGLLPLLHCRLGAVTRRPSISILRGAVIVTHPKAGLYRSGTAVDLTISDGAVDQGPAIAATGSGSNGDPYTGSCSETVEGNCVVHFASRELRGFLSNEYVPAYRCPAGYPWLLKKTITEGRILPPGVQFTADALHGSGNDVAVNITGVSFKEGRTERRANKVYAFDYATGTLTGFPNSSVTNYNLLRASYRISLYCTADLSKASLANVRG